METAAKWITNHPEIEAANRQAKAELTPQIYKYWQRGEFVTIKLDENGKDIARKEKILMYCYAGESWDSTPIGQKGIYDITNKTAEEVARLADLQQEFMGRTVHIKRITGNKFDILANSPGKF